MARDFKLTRDEAAAERLEAKLDRLRNSLVPAPAKRKPKREATRSDGAPLRWDYRSEGER